MSRHFVALICDYESLNMDGSVFHRGVTVLSGFLLELPDPEQLDQDKWYWVTAGHCLQVEIDERIKKGELRIIGGSFMDFRKRCEGFPCNSIHIRMRICISNDE